MKSRSSRIMLWTLLSLTACNDHQLATQFGDTALGTVTYGIRDMLTGTPCKTGWKRVFVQETDEYGLSSAQTQEVWIDCKNPDVWGSNATQQVAVTYQMHQGAAYELLQTLKAGARGDVQALRSVGLENEDILLMAQYKLPTKRCLQALSKAWKVEERELRRVLRKVLSDAQYLKAREAQASK